MKPRRKTAIGRELERARFARTRSHFCSRLAGLALLVILLVGATTGCRSPLRGLDTALAYGMPGTLENPLPLPAIDREVIWNQTVDAVDDYFRIQREERVRLIGGILTEGRIDTHPLVGSTVFEPWRRDSTPGYEKWLATLQSIRRKATVRLIPAEAGYLLDVVVQKELEDLDKPESASAGGATLRHDGSLVRIEGPAGRFSQTLGWIPIGRDVSLEQQILADIQARLQSCVPTGDTPFAIDEAGEALPAQTAPPEWRGPEPLPPALPRLGPPPVIPAAPLGAPPMSLAPPVLAPPTGAPQLTPAASPSQPNSPFMLPTPGVAPAPGVAPTIVEPLPAIVEPLPAP